SEENIVTVRVIDWDHPDRNDFFLASQFWISGEIYKRRADLVGFVNGLPLVFIELKASHKRLENAFRDNLRDYKTAIPQLFWYNAFIILSNGSASKIGSLSSCWEHFAEWKKINSEGERGAVSLETMIRGTCAPARLLDLVENFTLFVEERGGTIKLIAKNHQYLGVNNAFRALTPGPSPAHGRGEKGGRLGVFWHTQGSGKSYSMIFFSQKVLRKLPGNWTFVIVTDRQELDQQIYRNFASAGAVTEPESRVRAGSGEQLRQLLGEDHRYLFTLIQKFHTDRGETYPRLSDRRDIIVMTDEAHRSQYDIFALNMRNALPNAAFIGFTGTPLMAGEEKTRAVFGDYVSIYNFKQSVDDNATVPLYYENRIPELQLTNPNLNADMATVLEEAELDEAQEVRLEREFAREYHLITRVDRLGAIAADIVSHFTGRGFAGKAMVVCVDKATAVRMYDKVQAAWARRIAEMEARLLTCDPMTRPGLEAQIATLRSTDMAVVVSQGQNEIEDMAAPGLDIRPHRLRMVKEDLATKFKDPDDPFRLVFVCAMWMTGFDAPACSTIYLDKPMRNHTLMQTIARANRVFGDKVNGLIVDYIGVFRNLQAALAIYGSASGGGVAAGDLPVQAKSALLAQLGQAIGAATAHCIGMGVDLAAIRDAVDEFRRIAALDDAVEALIANDAAKLRYLSLAADVARLYRAILPDPTANQYNTQRALFAILADKIRALAPVPDLSSVMDAVNDLLDDSIKPDGYVIRATAASVQEAGAGLPDHVLDLSKLDLDALQRRFAQGRKRIEAEKLRGALNARLVRLVRLNRNRMDYLRQFQAMIDEYNTGAANVETFFANLVAFAQGLDAEEQRSIAENLSEEELALFDLLTRPTVELTQAETREVKRVARELLQTLKAERLVLDWRKRQQARAAVKLAIEEALDRGLPLEYTPELFRKKCEAVYLHVYDSYYGVGRSLYALAA
ncbi:MAG: type I restriction endonuclease subunit R, partial [Chloroflexi bacterium]|nr:type I restriction endonuclease subunit R [Chloroflexota bacterium]